MIYLLFEILGSLLLAAIVGFLLGWFLCKLRAKSNKTLDIDRNRE